MKSFILREGSELQNAGWQQHDKRFQLAVHADSQTLATETGSSQPSAYKSNFCPSYIKAVQCTSHTLPSVSYTVPSLLCPGLPYGFPQRFCTPIAVFRYVAPCTLAETDRRFRTAYRLHHQED